MYTSLMHFDADEDLHLRLVWRDAQLAKCAAPDLQLASQGARASATTAPLKKCDQECGDHASLVRRSDGATYLNVCHFDRVYCKDHTLTPIGYGACATAKSTEGATSASLRR